MNQKHELWLECLEKLNDIEFGELQNLILGPTEKQKLSPPGDRSSFISDIETWRKTPDLLKAFIDNVVWAARCREHLQQLQQYPSIFSELATSSVTSDVIPFTNREDELRRLLDSFAPPYTLIDAPARYGKTQLLKRLNESFNNDGWLSAYVQVGRNTSLDKLIQGLGQTLDLKLDETQSCIKRLGSALTQLPNWSIAESSESLKDSKKGIVLLIDFEGRPTLTLVRDVIHDLIPVTQNYLSTLPYFQGANFRVVIAGRYLAACDETKTGPILFSEPYLLQPFSYKVICDTMQKFHKTMNRTKNVIEQLAAHLLHITGGHPGCIAQALQLYDGSPPDEFIMDFGDKIQGEIVSRVTDAVLLELPPQFSHLQNIMLNRLCVFRYLDSSLLNIILEECEVPGITKGYELGDELVSTYLFTRKKTIIRDDVVRRLLVIRLREELSGEKRPQDFSDLCLQAQEMYVSRMRDGKRQPELWAIEYLFQFLQQHASNVQHKDLRQKLREDFFNVAVPRILKDFVSEPDLTNQDRRNLLLETLRDDWEFQFVVNYYLRILQYDNTPYQELQRKIMNFFK